MQVIEAEDADVAIIGAATGPTIGNSAAEDAEVIEDEVAETTTEVTTTAMTDGPITEAAASAIANNSNRVVPSNSSSRNTRIIIKAHISNSQLMFNNLK